VLTAAVRALHHMLQQQGQRSHEAREFRPEHAPPKLALDARQTPHSDERDEEDAGVLFGAVGLN